MKDKRNKQAFQRGGNTYENKYIKRCPVSFIIMGKNRNQNQMAFCASLIL